MSLLERRKQLENEQALTEEKRKEQTRTRVANSIKDVFSNEKLVAFVEEKLVESGRLYITGFGCLCQGGACIDQLGFPDLLRDFEKEWFEKGVRVSYSIPGVMFTLTGAKISSHYVAKHSFKEIIK